MSDEFGIRSKRVVADDGVIDAVVLVQNGTIYDIVPSGKAPSGFNIIDAGNHVVMAGLVDSHVHVNEPGRTEWEGFETATHAAAAGGITTIADMPLNCDPVTTTLAAFEEKLQAIEGKLFVDCAFYGGVVPGNVDQLAPLIKAGVVGFKCFLIHSGLDEFPNVSESDLHQAMPILAKHGVPLLVHAELQHEGDNCDRDWNDKRSYKSFLESRPRRWENDAITLMLSLCRRYNCKVHIVHLSSADTVEEIKQAVLQKLPFTVETCPHYLTFASQELPDGDPRFKCAPPIREKENRERLWNALREGVVTIVVSDHSPCVPELKHLDSGNLKDAWGGISSLQFRLPVVYTEASQRGFGFTDLSRWLCQAPAEFIGFGHRKGKLAKGYDADLVVFDPDAAATISADQIFHKHKPTPYESLHLKGKVLQTYLAGKKIFDNGSFATQANGKPLLQQALKVPT